MTPVAVEAEVDVERSPEDVFDYCSDLRHEPEWNPMMKRIVKLTDGHSRSELATQLSSTRVRA